MPRGMDKLEPADLGSVRHKVKVRRGSPEERAFAEARWKELDGILDNGTFVPMP